MYHRIAPPAIDPWALTVAPERFDEHLSVLTDVAEPVSLHEFARARERGRLPARAVAVTFDDGYLDNLEIAGPTLEARGVPATVFVTSGAVGAAREFWWDALEQLLLRPGQLPNQLMLPVNGSTVRLDTGPAAHYTDAAHAADKGRAGCLGEPGSRLSFYHDVWQALRAAGAEDQWAALEYLAAWAGVGIDVRESHRVMNPDELRALTAHGVVDVGAHTVTHPVLTSLSVDAQHAEVARGRNELEEVLEQPVETFSYPFGAHDGETAAAVRAAGYSCACTVEEEAVWRRSDPFRLPRFAVRNWSAEQFEQRLWTWFRS